MLDSFMLALSVAVASTHVQARDITAPETIIYSSAQAHIDRTDALAMVGQLNSVRVADGLGTLTEDPMLSAIALEHADEMVRENYFGHHAVNGPHLADRFAMHGVHAVLIGENLAWCADTKEAARDLWQSPEHQANERDARYHHVGVAAIQTGTQGILYVQLFTE